MTVSVTPQTTDAARVASHPAGPDSTEASFPDVEFLDVTKRFGDVVAVDRMNLRIQHGEFYSLLGPSGCGKTTTLRMIAGFEQPTEGEILLAGQPIAGVPPYRRNVNTVFQHYALFPHMNVARNVGYGLRQRKVGKAEETRLVGEALELVRLGGYGTRRIWEMSGGQQQRVALARALVNRPTVLLLDEPLGALDLKLRKEMQLELKSLQREVGITFVYVTHDQEEALTMSDTIVVMRDGRIQQAGGPVELYERPANHFVADFIGTSNFLKGAVAEVADDGRLTVRTDLGLILQRPLDRSGHDARSWRCGDRRRSTGTPRRGRRRRRARFDRCQDKGRRPDPPGHLPGRPDRIPGSTDVAGELVVRRQNEAARGGAHLGLAPGDPVTVSWSEDANLVLVA